MCQADIAFTPCPESVDSELMDACRDLAAVQAAYAQLNDAEPAGPRAERAHYAKLTALHNRARRLAGRVCAARATCWPEHQARAALLRHWQDVEAAGWMATENAEPILAALIRDIGQAS